MVATESVTIKVPVGMSKYLITMTPETELTRNALLLYPYILNQTISHGRAAEILGIRKSELIDMIGVDNSADMLEIALEKKEQSGKDILYLQQDLREFELYGTVRAIVSVCDSMNYITDEADLLEVFRLVNNYLDPGGVFIFDLNTLFKYEQLGESVIAENREESSFIWENWYDPADQVNEYDLTLFIRNDEGLYEKYEETHYQKAYALETVCQLIRQAGMKLEAIYDAFTFEKPRPDSERVYIVAREQGK